MARLKLNNALRAGSAACRRECREPDVRGWRPRGSTFIQVAKVSQPMLHEMCLQDWLRSNVRYRHGTSLSMEFKGNLIDHHLVMSITSPGNTLKSGTRVRRTGECRERKILCLEMDAMLGLLSLSFPTNNTAIVIRCSLRVKLFGLDEMIKVGNRSRTRIETGSRVDGNEGRWLQRRFGPTIQ